MRRERLGILIASKWNPTDCPAAMPRETAGAVLFEIQLASAIRQATVSSTDEDCLSTAGSQRSTWTDSE